MWKKIKGEIYIVGKEAMRCKNRSHGEGNERQGGAMEERKWEDGRDVKMFEKDEVISFEIRI